MHAAAAAAILAFVATTSAAPSSRLQAAKRQDNTCITQTVSQPLTADVEASLSSWLSDVETVNSFLEAALGGSLTDAATIQAHASNAKTFASDEPCQLQTLANIPANDLFLDDTGDFNIALINTAAYQCAIGDLQNVFGTDVLDNLQTIIDNSGDLATVHTAATNINNIRCCNVLPDVDILWSDAAETFGGSVLDSPSTLKLAPRPSTCAAVDCSAIANPAAPASTCQSDDNGPFLLGGVQ